MKKIKTGADKLVEIIQDAKKISLDDAAKALGVSKDLVLEWAEFLDKEKLISINYSFSKVFFTERTMSSREIKESAKEIVHEKDAFISKIEYALASLEKESVNFNEIKKKFNDVQKGVKDELKVVETEISELEKYNVLKGNVDKDIEAQKKSFNNELKQLTVELNDKEEEYVKLYSKVIKEKEEIEEHKQRLLDIQKSQEEISMSIKSASAVLSKLNEDAYAESRLLKTKIKQFDDLKKDFDQLSKDVLTDKTKKIESMSNSLNKEADAISKTQEKLLADARAKVAKLDNYDAVSKKLKDSFEGFFNKLLKISKKIDEIDVDKESLNKNLLILRDKARAFKVMDSSNSLKKQAQELELQIKKQEEAKTKLLGKIRSLLDDLKV